MTGRIRRFFASATVVCSFLAASIAMAVDVPWDGGAGTTNWNTATNWANIGDGENIPEASVGERAVIGSDDISPAAQLNATAVISASPFAVGGIALGYRERSGGAFVNPAPAAGTLMGNLTITGGLVTSRSTNQASTGADGRVLVGVDGRGYLTMTGGELRATRLTVAGEDLDTGPGRSRVDLSGNAILRVQNSPVSANNAAENTATFGRDLIITGPNVTFSSFGRLTLSATNHYTANITSPTAHSVLRTSDNIAVVSGGLSVNFSGAGSSGHVFGQTWDLVDSPLAIAGNFTGLGANSDVNVTGLTTPNPIGTTYRVRKVSDGTGETLQLVYDRLLVLRVDRTSGQLSIRNPHGGPIEIDGYTVSSSLGSMVPTFSGISGQVTPPDTGWIKPVDGSSQPLNTVNVLTEIKQPIFAPPSNPTFNVTSVPSFPIGNGFNRSGVGANVQNFGTHGEDLVFSYSTPDGVFRGHVEYVNGLRFENNLVLRVNPTTGQAFLKNDSLETLTFDGYSITSSTGSLTGGAPWTGITTAGWQKSPATANALSQTNPTGSTTLAPSAQVAIGDIGAFTTQAAQDGLAFKFILSVGLEAGAVTGGDFDNDGDVDGRDFLVWQRGNSPSPLSATDLAAWQANYGGGGGGPNPPETTFRFGTVVFDNTAGVAAIAAVPEPATALLMAGVMCGLAFARRSRPATRCSFHTRGSSHTLNQTGATGMSRLSMWCAAVLTAVCGFTALSDRCVAVTQGIPLVNGDFELPGPAGTKVVAFDETGIPFAPSPVTPPVELSSGQLAGSIPGWTFTGGDGGAGEEACAGLGCEIFGDELPGDSGTEGKGVGNPGNELLLSTVDGKAFQTSAFNLPSIPATQKLLLTFDVHNVFTPTGEAELTAWIHYLDGGGNRQVLGSPLVVGPLAGFETVTLEFIGGSAALTPALGRPIGVTFDTTSRERDATVVESWAGIDDVLLEIAGTLPGDFDGDGDIDLTDYGIIRDNLEESHSYLFQGDIVRDGFVDLNDFRAWKSLPSVISSGVLAQIASIPEPSSAMLIIGGIAMMGTFRSFPRIQSSPRRRGPSPLPSSPPTTAWCPRGASSTLFSCSASRRQNGAWLSLLITTSLALLCITSPASAELLAYDPFLTGANPAAGQYTVGPLVSAPGSGQNPTIGPTSFFNGAWNIPEAGVNGTAVQANGLSFLGAPAAGGSLVVSLDENSAVIPSRAGRLLATPFTATTVGTYYISYLANFGGVGINPSSTSRDDVAHRALEFWDESGAIGDGSAVFRIGYMSYNGNFNSLPPSQAPLKAGPFGQEVILEGGPASFVADNGSTHLIVLKLTLSDQPTSDTVEVFLNPTENEEPIIANAAFFNRDFTLGAISGTVQFGGAGTPMQVDEIRVATTFIDALPDFPMKGDTNGDDLVNQLDYLAIIQNMNLTGRTTAQGDVTGDGRVDLRDLRLWRDNRTDLPGLGAIGDVTVPEPGSLILLVASLGGLLARRSGR